MRENGHILISCLKLDADPSSSWLVSYIIIIFIFIHTYGTIVR